MPLLLVLLDAPLYHYPIFDAVNPKLSFHMSLPNFIILAMPSNGAHSTKAAIGSFTHPIMAAMTMEES
jgi:hypothetical protein